MYQTPSVVTPVYEEERPRRRRRGILALLLGLTTLSLGAGMATIKLVKE